MISMTGMLIAIVVLLMNLAIQLYLIITGYTCFELFNKKLIYYLQKLRRTWLAPFKVGAGDEGKNGVWMNLRYYF